MHSPPEHMPVITVHNDRNGIFTLFGFSNVLFHNKRNLVTSVRYVSLTAAVSAVVLEPKSTHSLLCALSPGFSVLGFSFPSLYANKVMAFSYPIFPLSPGFLYPPLAVNCLLQGFLWYRMLLHSVYKPCPLRSSKFAKCCN